VAKKVVSLKNAAPFIIGANIGTTITAFIAAALNSNTGGAISIAIAHFLFNFLGMLFFFPVPALRQIPLELANGLGRVTLRYRLAGLLYLLLTFFFIPFSLIYFNKDTMRVMEITYRKTDTTHVESFYRVVSSLNMRTESGEWATFAGEEKVLDEMPTTIYPVSFKNNSLFAGKSLFLFNKPGFCWDGEDEQGKYEGCVEKIHPRFNTHAGQQFDSVYQCSVKYDTAVPDSLTHRYFISAPLKIIVRHDIVNSTDDTLVTEEAIRYSPK
jgi:sodium-dependent phosphate cotransporter